MDKIVKNENLPHIIVGGGLAGIFAAIRMIDRGQKIVLFYDPNWESASMFSAGIFNTITGIRAAKTWMADELTRELYLFFSFPKDHFFAPLNKHLVKTPIYRPFKNLFELNEWTIRAGTPLYGECIDIISKSIQWETLKDNYGGVCVKNTGKLNVQFFIAEALELFSRHPDVTVIPHRLNYENIDPENSIIHIDKSEVYSESKLKFASIIFAEGLGIKHNPFFKTIKVFPLKGEVLKINAPINPSKYLVIHNSLFMIPSESTFDKTDFYIGSTHEREFETPQPTEAGKKLLIERWNSSFEKTITFEIIQHFSGLRPTTPDRRPYVGCHPQFKNLYIFNGLGTKGVLLGPYFSKVLIELILDKNLNYTPEVNIRS